MYFSIESSITFDGNGAEKTYVMSDNWYYTGKKYSYQALYRSGLFTGTVFNRKFQPFFTRFVTRISSSE